MNRVMSATLELEKCGKLKIFNKNRSNPNLYLSTCTALEQMNLLPFPQCRVSAADVTLTTPNFSR